MMKVSNQPPPTSLGRGTSPANSATVSTAGALVYANTKTKNQKTRTIWILKT